MILDYRLKEEIKKRDIYYKKAKYGLFLLYKGTKKYISNDDSVMNYADIAEWIMSKPYKACCCDDDIEQVIENEKTGELETEDFMLVKSRKGFLMKKVG